jgi:ATP-dependent RNA helicase DDX56/DBP9
LRNPAILQLEEEDVNLLTQYQISCSEEDKFLYMLFMLKLKVHPFGSHKTIIFVNSIDRCYKLKLFLEQFGIKSCALNSELPVKSRFHIVQEFNRGVYDFIIATDEANETKVEIEDSDEEQEEEKQDAEKAEVTENAKKTKKKKSKQDQDYGVSRGIDFRNVTAVINFDMPRTSRNYQHRVGRTARGVGNKGYALTFVCPAMERIVHTRKKSKQSKSRERSDEEILERIEKRQEGFKNSCSTR